MINYQFGKIYKLIDLESEKCYIGSTCKTLNQRLYNHKKHYKEYLNGTMNYLTSFEILENDDFDIVLIEDYPCQSKNELSARERYFTNQIQCVNKIKSQGLILDIGLVEKSMIN